jgi:malic enzyme
MIENPTPERIIPGVFDAGVADVVAAAVRDAARAEGAARTG